MLGDSSVLGSAISRDAATTAAVAVPEGGGGDGGGGGGGSNSGEDTFRGGGGGDDLLGSGERSFGGNRWPRQETLALLQIRSDMDVAFRDASVKGPLWDEVSRKLAALGYHRSAKKCKEKFENVYKYHRRTKEGRTGKSEGKTYRFFDQLEALENQPSTPGTTHHHQAKPHHQSTMAAAAATMATMASTIPSSAAPHPIISNVSSQAIAAPALNVAAPNSFSPTNPIVLPPPPQPPPPTMTNPTNNPHHHHHNTFPSSFPNISADLSTSSSTSSDEDLEGRAKRKRKWKDFFQRLMKEVIQKQEDLQKRFLEAIEKREHEKMVREEAWRMQEMARVNREREILAQERSIAAAKDAAVMSFLQKISEQQQNPNQSQNQTPPPGQSQINNNLLQLQPPPLVPPPPRQPAPPPQQPATNFDLVPKPNNNGENNNLSSPASSSRWPKVEVQALIKLRTSLDSKYQENGPKGPLWEEISGAMRKLGYNRSSKRCKEKWENINKYFKKVKESNKRRPEDSKTCPYFHQLDSLYRERNKFDHNNVNPKPENSVPLMVRPEQQWPPPTPQQQQQQQQQDHQNMDIDHQNQEDDRHDHQDKENIIGGDEDEEEEDDDDEEDEEEDEGDGNYEIVANKPAPVGAAAAE
ncbi:trihelix transcription factor GT-2-like [Prunus yedoensis var. nudiflora]|uniref:Trihelix transcription factor GT-2-like n=1 Tax=Prunus yedoensis var. nudiflora TaxID=2094558 RepID=A0A314URC0_PRUYE|nr:trihelix transcription factor GT-2-like [Prunus yedoensis var. nudiflora]